jgi:glucose-6-phosphate 1-dehydrogenase
MSTGHANSHSLRIPDPCVMVIFGASGDLTRRKLIPALYNLATGKLLPERFAIVGCARSPMTDDAFREQLTQGMKTLASTPVDPSIWNSLLERIQYVQCDVEDAAGFQRLATVLAQLDKERGTQGNRIFYLAIAPQFFAGTVEQLGKAGLASESNGQYARVVFEKPFGHDLQSARELNRAIKQVLDEKQIYRIDHYLGKETVQNLLVFRFANSIAEPLWNRNLIDHVQITAAETVGVEGRGGYYETAGALRDMVPNHLFQLMTLVAMEPPISFEADAVRDKQTEILHAIQPPTPEEVAANAIRGQYGPSASGPPMPGYREEPSVAPDSNVETFVALKFNIDNWRWADVPFYLRTGKRLSRRVTEIAIQFRRTPFALFRNTPVTDLEPNRLVIHIQPQEGISLCMGAKIPGPVMRIGEVSMDFDYERQFQTAPATGYERLLHDCMIGDQTLFQRADMVEAAWAVIAPIQQVWGSLPSDFPNYAAGSEGPAAADALLHEGCQWKQIDAGAATAK